MKSAVVLLLTNVVCAQEAILETSEATLFGQYVKAINEAAPYVQLNESTFSDHSSSGYVAIQQDVYSQNNTAEWEELMRKGIIQNITSAYYEGAHSVLFVDSIAEWKSGPGINFTVSTSGNSHTPTAQNELEKRSARGDRYWVFFGKLSGCVTAFNGFADFAGHCANAGQVFNKVVNYLNQDPNSQHVSLYYGSNCYNRVLQVWVDAWQDRCFTGDDFSSIFVDYGSTTAPS